MSGGKRAWIKRFTDRHDHPDIQAAGFWGAIAFDEICAIAGQFGLEGEVPGKYATPVFIARRTMADRLPDGVERMREGLEECVNVGLLVPLEHGGFAIPGWERVQPETSTDRVQRHRAKKQAQRHAQYGETDETLRNVSGTDETPRIEEKRIEEIRDPPPKPPSAGAAGGGRRKRGSRRARAEPSATGRRVLERVNELAGTAYEHSPHLEARIAEGVPEGDLLAVVEAKAADPWWLGTVRLRPSALFRPERFREHLGETKGAGPPPAPVSRRAGPAPLPDHPPPPQDGDRTARRCLVCADVVQHTWTDDGWVPDDHACLEAERSTA